MPDIGYVKVGELKAKLAGEAKVAPAPVVELEKIVAEKVVERSGRLTRAEMGEILVKVKEEKGCEERSHPGKATQRRLPSEDQGSEDEGFLRSHGGRGEEGWNSYGSRILSYTCRSRIALTNVSKSFSEKG
jgi:hypothetical protein